MTSRSLHRSSLAVVYAQGLDFGGAGNATVAWHRVGEYPKKRYGEFTKYTEENGDTYLRLRTHNGDFGHVWYKTAFSWDHCRSDELHWCGVQASDL